MDSAIVAAIHAEAADADREAVHGEFARFVLEQNKVSGLLQSALVAGIHVAVHLRVDPCAIFVIAHGEIDISGRISVLMSRGPFSGKTGEKISRGSDRVSGLPDNAVSAAQNEIRAVSLQNGFDAGDFLRTAAIVHVSEKTDGKRA